MFFVFAGAGLALVALVATAAMTALFLTQGTQNDLRKIKLITVHYCMNEFNNTFPLSDLLDQHEEGGETPTDQDVERVHPQNVRFQNVRFQNVRFQNVRFQNVRFTKRQVYKTSGFKTSGFKTSGFKRL
jgi:hypothetical protein